MPNSPMSRIIHHIRKAALAQDEAEATDAQLLESFVSRREEAALEALVGRHRSMVWAVCRRLLNHHDAEDAFQATFLVLVRKAASIVPRKMVGNWLYGVAHQAALNARVRITKRRAREVQVMEMPEPVEIEQNPWHDLQPILDQELSRLPDKYRVAIVLCDLEGKSRKEASRQLGLPEGTVASRLARARTMLGKRLTRHGLALSGGTVAAALSHTAASACVPTTVVSSTIKTVIFVAAGNAMTDRVISVKVAALTQGVLKAMFMSKIKVTAEVLAVLAIVALGAGGLLYHTQAAAVQEPTQKTLSKAASDEKKGQGVDADGNDKVRLANGDVPAEQAVRLKVVLRVSGGIAKHEAQNIVKKMMDVQNDMTLDVLNADPSVSPNAQIRVTKDTPRKTIVKVVDALLGAGVLKISIGDSFKTDGTVNPIKSKENIEGRWITQKDNGKYEMLDIVFDHLTWTLGQTNGNGGVESSNSFSYNLDPTKTPKELDLIALDGPFKGKAFPCIYLLDGDTLKVCTSQPGKERPKKFESAKDSSQRFLTLQLEKP